MQFVSQRTLQRCRRGRRLFLTDASSGVLNSLPRYNISIKHQADAVYRIYMFLNEVFIYLFIYS